MPIKINAIHHIAIICSNYEASKKFYTQILGFTIRNEIYRDSRQSYKLDLELNGQYVIELFSFPSTPLRLSRPEACGLRHIAFAVDSVEEIASDLNREGITTEAIRTDEFTGKKFTFIQDPDGLPIEFYEQ